MRECSNLIRQELTCRDNRALQGPICQGNPVDQAVIDRGSPVLPQELKAHGTDMAPLDMLVLMKVVDLDNQIQLAVQTIRAVQVNRAVHPQVVPAPLVVPVTSM
ncbi:MAG: hypothetical protein M3P47_03935 [Pseudomonadota bacterium]|nr:hypothetical protein [Pseudomonadota bacterium]